MSKGKEKQPNEPMMLNPASGSTNPAASLPALWSYLLPALDHIVKSASNDQSGKAPAIDVCFYSGIHSACYNYFTSHTEALNPVPSSGAPDPVITNGTDVYQQLDKYFADAARELALGVPSSDADLIHYIVPCFNRYSAGAQAVNRLLNYVNRHYVKRAIEEDRGWLRLVDVLDSVTKTLSAGDGREKIAKKLREHRVEELKRWGYEEGRPPERAVSAEACAEAASPLDRIVPVASLAHRRFRTEFVEPLLVVPKMKGTSKGKHKVPKISGGPAVAGPRGRLARAVKELMECERIGDSERSRLVADLACCLRTVGVRPDHPVRKKLDKFVVAHPGG